MSSNNHKAFVNQSFCCLKLFDQEIFVTAFFRYYWKFWSKFSLWLYKKLFDVCLFEVFTVPHIVWLDSDQTQPDNHVPRIQIFVVKFPIIFQPLSSHNSSHFPTRQFVHQTVQWTWPETDQTMTGQWLKLSLLLLLIKNKLEYYLRLYISKNE